MAETPATPDPAQVQQAIKDVQTPANADPIEIKTSTGQVFKGATMDDVVAEMKKSIENGTVTIRDQNQKLAEFQARPEPQTPQAPISADDQVNAKYWEKWQKSPIEAQNFLDSVRLGIPEDQVPQVLRGTLAQTQATQQQQGGAEFQQRCPDFPDSPAAVQLLIGAMNQRYGNRPAQSASELADRLEVTYGQLVRNNQITPADLPISSGGGGGPIPPLGASSTSQSVDLLNEQNFRRLTPDQMKAAIEKLAAQGNR